MIRNEVFADGVCVEAEVVDLAAGTVSIEVGGKVVETRPVTEEEIARYAPPAPPLDDRLDALEATNAELLDALAKATTLAQVRAQKIEGKNLPRDLRYRIVWSKIKRMGWIAQVAVISALVDLTLRAIL